VDSSLAVIRMLIKLINSYPRASRRCWSSSAQSASCTARLPSQTGRAQQFATRSALTRPARGRCGDADRRYTTRDDTFLACAQTSKVELPALRQFNKLICHRWDNTQLRKVNDKKSAIVAIRGFQQKNPQQRDPLFKFNSGVWTLTARF